MQLCFTHVKTTEMAKVTAAAYYVSAHLPLTLVEVRKKYF